MGVMWTDAHRATLETLVDAWVTPETSLAIGAALEEIDRLQMLHKLMVVDL